MPKPPRTTNDPLGQKLLYVLREKGTADDLHSLAAAFGVKVQSTYDWIEHGRMAKERYTQLVKWSGRSLDWWFDVPTANTAIAASHSARPPWPFPDLDEHLICSLDRELRLQMSGALKMLVGQQSLCQTATVTAAPGKRAASTR